MNDLAQYRAIFKLIDFNLLQNNLSAFSIEKKLLAIAHNDKIYIYNTITKKQIHTIKSYDEDIKQLSFIPNSQHILTTTKSGRVIIYNYKDLRYNIRIFSLIKKSKIKLLTEITTFAFKDQYLAIATSNGKVIVINLGSYSIIKEINITNIAISTLCFTDISSLIIIDIDGRIFTHDLQELEKTKYCISNLSNTKQIVHIPKSDLFLIHSNQNFITLFDLKSNKILQKKYLKFHTNISYITITEENDLLVVLQNREILHIILQNEKKLRSLFLHNMIFEAYTLVENNPQLLNSQEYQEMEKHYKIKYLKAINALQHSNKEKAQQQLENYIKIKSKKDDIALLFKAYSYYERFQILCMQKVYTPAYALSEKFPPLQYSKEYKELEKEYKKAYKNAQKEIFLMNTKKAKELLFPYLGVISKKDSINLILKNNQDFLSFLDAIRDNKYQNIKKLLEKHPKFSELPPYQEFLNRVDLTLNNINSELNRSQLKKATTIINNLKGISYIEEKLNFLEQKAKIIKILVDRYNKNEFKKCYEIIDEYPQIFIEVKLAKMLEKHWNKLMQECEKYALYGNIKAIKSRLKELISVKSRTKIVGELLRITFIVTIDNFIAQSKFSSAENFIYSYIDIFGFDTNLKRVMKEYEKISRQKLAIISEKERVGRNDWLNNKIIIS